MTHGFLFFLACTGIVSHFPIVSFALFVKGVRALADALKKNTSLILLNISYNDLDKDVMPALIAALKVYRIAWNA